VKTALITGCSSGYGLETARHFHAKGWNVIATMRTTREDLFPKSERLRVLPLDVTKPESIASLIDAAGQVDALVNNAGIGFVGALEATSMERTRALFETNTFGTIAMTQAVVPQMRMRKSGVIVNVTSSVALTAMPLASVYTGSKVAIEGFTGSLAYELRAFNVRVKLVEPGYAPTTRFSQNADFNLEDVIPAPYQPFAQPILEAFTKPLMVTKETDVAEAVFRAANDESTRLHYPAGADAVALAKQCKAA
jgi:NAD(P)-dependent dehydrogenase (short-subunit alcohol dehydrogenase family)